MSMAASLNNFHAWPGTRARTEDAGAVRLVKDMAIYTGTRVLVPCHTAASRNQVSSVVYWPAL